MPSRPLRHCESPTVFKANYFACNFPTFYYLNALCLNSQSSQPLQFQPSSLKQLTLPNTLYEGIFQFLLLNQIECWPPSFSLNLISKVHDLFNYSSFHAAEIQETNLWILSENALYVYVTNFLTFHIAKYKSSKTDLLKTVNNNFERIHFAKAKTRK